MQHATQDLKIQDIKGEITDSTVTMQELKKQLAQFVQERDWDQFHSPKNMSMVIAIEAAELMEKFRWLDSQQSYQEVEKSRQEIEDELADVVVTALMFANCANIDVSRAIAHKMAKNARKYPVEKAKGNCDKYTNLK